MPLAGKRQPQTSVGGGIAQMFADQSGALEIMELDDDLVEAFPFVRLDEVNR